MADLSKLAFTLSLLLLLLSTSSSFSAPPPSQSTTPPPPFSLYEENLKPPQTQFSSITSILTDLGFHDLAMAAYSLSLSSAPAWTGPTTIFAPLDSSLRTCPSCSTSLLLQEHAVPGLYPLDYLQKLAFGTKIETILPGRCLTVTLAVNSSKIFIGGAEITRPDLFNNGHVIIHGLQGFVSHLSPYSCSIDKMTSLSLPHPSPAFAVMRFMLTDAMVRLRTSGYSVLALALRVKYPELVTLHNMTVFALDDSAIFHGGHAYVRDVRFHIVPNRLLMEADLEKLAPSTILQTLESSESLVVTTAGGGGVLAPMRINYVRIKSPDLIHNLKIVVHGLALPFPHLGQPSISGAGGSGRSGFGEVGAEMWGSGGAATATNTANAAAGEVAQSPAILSTVEIEDHHGL